EADEKQERTLTGRVLDPSGKPVPKADVAVLVRLRQPLRILSLPTILAKAQADADGQFRLTMRRLPREGYWGMEVIACGAGLGLGWHHLNEERDWTNPTIRLVREQILRGRLVDLQGQPAAGVQVHVIGLAAVIPNKDALYVETFFGPPEGLPCWPKSAITDKEGRFSLKGMAHVWQATIQVRDDRFAVQNLSLKPGEKGQPQEITLALHPARVIDGTVTYEDTGKPAVNARLIVNASEEEDGPFHPAQCPADHQ